MIRWSQSKSLLEKHLIECPYESVSGLITKMNDIETVSNKTHSFQRSLQKRLERVADGAEKVTATVSLMSLEHGYLKSQVKEVMISIVNLLIMLDSDREEEMKEEKK